MQSKALIAKTSTQANRSICRGISNMPFRHHQEAATLEAYKRPFKCFIAMLFRAARDHASDDDHWIHRVGLDSTTLASIVSDGATDTPHLSANSLIPMIHMICVKAWQQTFPIHESPLEDPTYRFCVYYSVQRQGNHLQVKWVTKLFAQLKYMIRLSMLYTINQTPPEKRMEECLRIKPYFSDKALASTFTTICNWQHVASSIVYSERALPRLIWKDRIGWSELVYQGEHIRLSEFQKMFHSMEKDMVTLFESLSLGQQHRVDIGSLKEDLSQTSPGYSFLTDPRNHALRALNTHLMDAIIRTPTLLNRFTVVLDGVRQWNRTQLARWLVDYSALCRLELLRAELLSGGPARGTELTSMLFRSSAEQPTRNLSLLDAHVVLICTYSKTTAASGKDRIIPHSLDGVTSDILIQDLAILRPFAFLVSRVLYPDNTELHRFYRSSLFVNNTKLFTTSDITDGIRHYSLESLGFSLTHRDLRHVNVAFRRKLCPHATSMLENHHEDYIGAEQAGHSFAIENHIYGRSPDALAVPSEDIFELFLLASSSWQKAMRCVPGISFHSV
jgi:hypothetical protein